MVTSSAVVGSSAISSLGVVGQRGRDHHPLALAARELVRIGVQPLLGVREADLAQQLQHARAQRRAVQRLVQGDRLAHLAPDRVQRVERGHRLLEDHAGDAAAEPAQRRPRRRASTSLPSRVMRPSGLAPLGGSRRSTERAVTDLPLPLSPTSATVSPRLDGEGDAAHDAAAAEGDRQVLDREQGGRRQRSPDAGSTAGSARSSASEGAHRPRPPAACADRRRRAPPRRRRSAGSARRPARRSR